MQFHPEAHLPNCAADLRPDAALHDVQVLQRHRQSVERHGKVTITTRYLICGLKARHVLLFQGQNHP